MSREPTQKELLQRINDLEEQVEYLEGQVGIYQAQNRARQAVVDNFQRLADRAQEAIYHYDIATRDFTFFNTRFHQLFRGQGPKSITPKNVLMHIHPEDRPKVKAAKAASLTAESAMGEAEYRFMLPTREIRWMQDRWIVIHDRKNRATAIEGFIRDITANKQVAEELKLARHNALIGIYIVQQGRFKYVNPAFSRITGYSQEELLGTPSLNLVMAEDRRQVREAAIQMLKKKRTEPYEFRIHDKAGQIRWIMETVASIRHDDRRAVVGDFMDISAKMTAVQQ